MKIGILSDTHDLLRPEVIGNLQGCRCILHAGDISSRRILEELEQIAPVKAVRGNNDKEWAEHLPMFLDMELGGLRVYMTHIRRTLPGDLSAYDLVITGHSHQYSERWLEASGQRRTLLLNPGSCGPRRFDQKITMAMLTVWEDGWAVERIGIRHAGRGFSPGTDPGDLRRQVEMVCRELEKGRTIGAIAEKTGIDGDRVEQIARLFVTHPGVTVEGIMERMGL